ncbi:MAG: tetratricopeptide repeat-containing sensor histidine kinase [Candidatus Stygibacter frigidus]|nr:tetratricopeptide repeat-containing sensor histidine kinase [Candidatus Stygibacter frigidus]
MERKEYLDKIAESEGDEKYQAILKYAWFLRQKEPMESAKQAKIVLKYARAENNIKFEFSALSYLCYAHFYHSDMEETGKWADELKKVGEKHDNARAIGSAYSTKSRIALQQNNTSEAMEKMLVALKYYLKENSVQELISSYNALGMIHLVREENTEAEHYLQLALEKAVKIDSHAQHSIRVNISNILYKQQKFEESLKMNLNSLQYFQSHNMDSSMATVLLNIGLSYRYLGDNEAALINLKKSYQLCKKINDPRELGLAANAIAHVYILKSDWVKALKYLKEAVKLAEDNNLKINIASCYTNYAKYHETKGEFEEANNYLHKLVAVKEEINNENNQEKISVLETQYKTQIYRMQSAELDKKNKVMNNQVTELNKTLEHLQQTYQTLQGEFQEAVNKLNAQDDLLSTQSRMSLMGGMISAIAHQWKQPLNVIWVLVQAIEDSWQFDELTEEFMDNQVKQIGDQVSYMAETVNDFSKFFKPDYVQEYSVSETIEKALKLLAYMLKSSGISLIKELEDNCRLSGNPNELSQVIINIVNNAREAILRDKINGPDIRIKMKCNEERINITIYNKGNHIKPENLEKIFEPYFTTRGNEGTGIGLQICRQIIENKYNGSIKANNCEGGVEFVIEMPKLQK